MRGTEPHRVVVAGAGVAGLEAVLALRDLAEERVEVEVLAPEREFSYRPLAVAEPFETAEPHRFELAGLLAEQAVAHVEDALAAVDPVRGIARTASGRSRPYDALVVACGARPHEALPGALTFRGGEDREAFRALLGELAAGSVRRVVFAVPAGKAWPLPLYELALMTRAYAAAHGADAELALVTPEPEPLGVFGGPASEAVRRLLEEQAVRLVAGAYPVAVDSGGLATTGGGRVEADRVVALPRLEGPRVRGLPHDAEGFIPTDLHGSVRGLTGVYAAGDAAAYPIKQGGLAAQQADAVAEAIAARAGAAVTPRPFRPVLRGLLLTGGAPRFLRADVAGGCGETSIAAAEALWWPPSKIAGRYLGPYLAAHAGIALPEPPAGPGAVAVEVELED